MEVCAFLDLMIFSSEVKEKWLGKGVRRGPFWTVPLDTGGHLLRCDCDVHTWARIRTNEHYANCSFAKLVLIYCFSVS